MRFEAIEIQEYCKYSFIVGTAEKPDNSLKEMIREQIGDAMGALGRAPDSYSVSILQNEEPEEARDTGYPELKMGRKYILFAMLRSSESSESLSIRELEEQKEELSKGIICPKNSRIALVLLYDSSISLMNTQKPSNAKITFIENDNPWKRF